MPALSDMAVSLKKGPRSPERAVGSIMGRVRSWRGKIDLFLDVTQSCPFSQDKNRQFRKIEFGGSMLGRGKHLNFF